MSFSKCIFFTPIPKQCIKGKRTIKPRRINRLLVSVSLTQNLTRPWKVKDCRLILEDGSTWKGAGFGVKGTQIGEVVFNTSMTGYQEIMTDPSYKGQFVCFTYPHIGNVGVNIDDVESNACHLGGMIVRDLSISVSNYRATMSLQKYCEEANVIGISDIDTRALTKRIREKGSLVGVLTTDDNCDVQSCVEDAKAWSIEGQDLLKVVSCREPYAWSDSTGAEWEFSKYASQRSKISNDSLLNVVAYDFGIKQNIMRRFMSYGCKVTVVPCDFDWKRVLDMKPDGVFFSNGPGDPSAAPYAVENAKNILGKVPVFGICMGHQILGQAFGGHTYKLKFGHHGGNHPIRYMPTGRIEISAQNHNFAVDPSSLPEGIEITHINLNDGTCAGMFCEKMKAMTIQYHPEASPGPHDADPSFEKFVKMMIDYKTSD